MTIHKLQPDRDDRDDGALSVGLALTEEMYDVADAVMRARAVRACDMGTRSLPVYRQLRWSVQRKLNDVFDDLALDAHFSSQRISSGVALLSAPGVFVSARGHDKVSYCSCVFQLWAESRARAEEAAQRLQDIAGDQRVREQSFFVNWYFCVGGGDLRSASFEEVVTERLLDAAYPSLGGGVRAFVDAYLDAPESVLILLGPPGGGKTRLVREVLASLSRRKGENAKVMYTTDKRALASDALFVEFITGAEDAFVIEDTDHLLRARTSGNDEMHRFLSIADGITRAQKRKIIFTTNLPNVTDIDPALIRPGRCFGVRNLRSLTLEEALVLAARLCADDADRLARARATLTAEAARSYPVAQVYRVCA